jgi:hypothetical protein
MRVSCPGCLQTSDNIDPDLEGCMFKCKCCGTEWVARRYVARNGFQGALDRPPSGTEGTLIDYSHRDFGPRASASGPGTIARPASAGWTRGRVAGVVLAAMAAVMMAKVPIVSALPEGGKIASVSASNELLRFDRVRGEHDTVDGANHLIVVGDVVNPTRIRLALPSVRVALRAADGTEVRNWRINLARSDIEPGETIHFRSAVVGPPRSATDVKLTMVPRLGRSAALQQ